MISLETFVKTMNRLKTLDSNMNDVDNAVHKLSPDFCSFYIPECIDMVVDILHDIFEDKDDWLYYFVFDLEYLTKYEEGCVTESDGTIIDVSDWEKVYYFLIDNMAKDKGE